jgi:hypothetical protein
LQGLAFAILVSKGTSAIVRLTFLTTFVVSKMLPINEKLSKYAEKLPVPARTPYLAKLEVNYWRA